MTSQMTLSTGTLAVRPGETVTCEVRLRNNGRVVDQFRLVPLGPGSAWTTVEPHLLNLFPNEEGQATVTMSPPRSPDVPAGPTPFAVRAHSREEPSWSQVVEGSVEVGEFTEALAWLHPRTAHGSRKGRFQLYIDNRGNLPLESEITALDPDSMLTFDLAHKQVVTQPGTASVVKLRARPRRTFARGADQLQPFQVLVRTGAGEPVTADGALNQRQLMPAWLMPALAVAGALAVALAVLWFTTLRPAITSAARAEARSEELASEVEAAKAQAQQAGQEAALARQGAPAGTGPSAKPSSSVGPGGSGSVDSGSGAVGSKPYDFRINVDAAVAGGYQLASFTVPTGRILLVTDIVLQNPRGDSGLLRIQRGSAVLIETGLDNFRDLDYHFVEPLAFTAGQKVTVGVDCANGSGAACSPAVYFSGQLRVAASAEPSRR